MILIQDEDFIMTQVKDLPFFELKLHSIINEGKATERIEMKIDSHAWPFEMCIKTIVSLRLEKIDKTYSVIEFMKLYCEEVEKIKRLVTYALPPPKKSKVKDDEDDEDLTGEEHQLNDE